MSIFKRGKHAKVTDEDILSFHEWRGQRVNGGAHPVSEERETVELYPESIQRIAEGVRPHVTFTHEDVQNWPEYKEWRDLLKEGVSFSVDGAEETPSFYQVAGSKPVSPFEEELDKVLGEIRALLLEKNASYGDSALNPVRIMSDAAAAEQIRIRMDDKLSRLYRGFAFEDTETGNPEDTLKDLVGYYFLLKIAEARNAQS